MAKVEIKVPEMGESITEATVGQIFQPSGAQVAVDDELLELETEKVNQVLYAPESGTVSYSVGVDDTVAVGQVIGALDTAGKATSIKGKKAVSKKEATKEKAVAGKGKGARLGKDAFVADVLAKEEKAAPKAAAAPVKKGERKETRKRLTKIRRVIAERLVEAQQTTAMLTTFNEADLSQVIALRLNYRDAFSEKYGVRLGFMGFFVKAVVAALQAFPDINAYIDGNELVYREYYDVGIAVGTDRGLVVPVLRDCDAMTYAQIEQNIADYAKKAREGGLSVEDLQGGSFTITNGGVYGSLLSTPILNPPQSAILGMHKIQRRPVAVEEQVVIRPMMYLALSYDHRVVDGQTAVSFLVHVKDYLENPARPLLGL